MPHMHWVVRQNKLELPNDEEEVNTRDIHECDGQAHDPDTMAAPPTPKPTRKKFTQLFGIFFVFFLNSCEKRASCRGKDRRGSKERLDGDCSG